MSARELAETGPRPPPREYSVLVEHDKFLKQTW